MKKIIVIFSLLLSCNAVAQPDKVELRNMIMLCNSYTFLELYNSDKDILPMGYVKRYTSPEMGMDNKFQVYTKGDTAIINIRGSTTKVTSWMENIHSAMIPGIGTMTVQGKKFNYVFAKEPAASVHSGYALAVAFMHNEIINQINLLNKEGIYEFIITGHSQGGALACMLRAYLENCSKSVVAKKNKFRTYAFAAPMIGNKRFAEEYNNRYIKNSCNFNCVNPADAICKMPLSYNDTMTISSELANMLFNNKNYSFKKTVKDGTVNFFEGMLRNHMNSVGTMTSKHLSKDLGEIGMPKYVKDINYFPIKEKLEIKPFEFPKILKDSSILKNPELMAKLKKDEKGNFIDDELYVKEGWGYQHKTYNYYVGILKAYFPQDYASLKMKYLPENVKMEEKK